MTEREEVLIEPRWPVVVAVLVVFALLTSLRSRIHVLPFWVACVAIVVIVVTLIAVSISTRRTLWLRIERVVIAGFFALYGPWTLVEVGVLLQTMSNPRSQVGGLQLLTSSITVWATNVVMFSLAYWRIDRGGPEARMNNVQVMPDWHFPIEDVPERLRPPDWVPEYLDYLFIAFTTSTSFSPTEAMPLTRRAKLLMMTEGSISLVTLLAIFARAINILGGSSK
ncbi:MAG TPA: hypothetical protein VF214_00725 [Edaphobacter sp.]